MQYPVLSAETIFRRLDTNYGHKAELYHCAGVDRAILNNAAEEVILRCDGARSIGDIAQDLSGMFAKTPVGVIAERVGQILEPLVDSGYVQFNATPVTLSRAMPPVVSIPMVLNNLFFEATNACNLRCVHCCVSAEPDADACIGLPQVMAMVDQFAAAGGLSVVISGGEPLLRRDIFDIIAYVVAKPMVPRLLSNGFAITRPLARRLKEAGLNHVQLSLDGSCAADHDAYRGVPGSFDRVMAAYDHLKAEGISIDVATVLNRTNIGKATDIVDLGKRMGFTPVFDRQAQYGRAITAGREYQISYQEYIEAQIRIRKHLKGAEDHLFKVSKREDSGHRCSAGTSSLTVRSNGDVVPCSNFFQEQAILGNVTRDDLVSLWKSDNPYLAMLRNTDRGAYRICSECRHAEYCSGGCPTNAYYIWGDYNWPDPERCAFFNLAGSHIKLLEKREEGEATVFKCT